MPTTTAARRDLPVALHAQIAARLRASIASGEWPAHYRLPPEPDLARELGVARGTLRRALAALVDEGLLVAIKGRGTFVTSTLVEPAIAQRLSSLAEDLSAGGVAWRTTVLSAGPGSAEPEVAALLGTGARPVFRLVRVRADERGPLAYLVNRVRPDLAPGLEEVDFTSRSLFDVLEHDHGLRLGTGRRTFDAVAADPVVAGHLALAPGTPLLHLEQTTYLADGRPLEHSDVWIHSTRVKVTSVLTRS